MTYSMAILVSIIELGAFRTFIRLIDALQVCTGILVDPLTLDTSAPRLLSTGPHGATQSIIGHVWFRHIGPN